MLLSASIPAVISDLHEGLQGRSLLILQMHNMQRQCWLCQRPKGGTPCHWGCPHDQKNLPRDFHQLCQTPGLCRSLWSGLAGDGTGYATCSPSWPPAWQQGAGISLLPEFSSVQLTLFLQLDVGDMHLIPAAPHGGECLSPTAPHGRYALWPCRSPLESHLCPAAGPGRHAARGHTDVHSAGATVARRGTVWALFEVTCRVAPLPHGCSPRRRALSCP